jgi:predicted HD phosphohydrolase
LVARQGGEALAEEEIALATLAEASDKVVKWRRMQAALKHEIDELYEDVEEEKDVARGVAEHEAQEREYTLLELQRARDSA